MGSGIGWYCFWRDCGVLAFVRFRVGLVSPTSEEANWGQFSIISCFFCWSLWSEGSNCKKGRGQDGCACVSPWQLPILANAISMHGLYIPLWEHYHMCTDDTRPLLCNTALCLWSIGYVNLIYCKPMCQREVSSCTCISFHYKNAALDRFVVVIISFTMAPDKNDVCSRIHYFVRISHGLLWRTGLTPATFLCIVYLFIPFFTLLLSRSLLFDAQCWAAHWSACADPLHQGVQCPPTDTLQVAPVGIPNKYAHQPARTHACVPTICSIECTSKGLFPSTWMSACVDMSEVISIRSRSHNQKHRI